MPQFTMKVTAIKEPSGASHPPPGDPSLPTHEFSMLIIAPRGSGKTTLILNLISNFYKGYFNTITVFSPTMAGDGKWETVKKMHGLLAHNTHRKELEGGQQPSVPKTLSSHVEVKDDYTYRNSWNGLFATMIGSVSTGETWKDLPLEPKKGVIQPAANVTHPGKEKKFTGQIPPENFLTDYDEEVLQAIMTRSMGEIEQLKAKGHPKHHADRQLLVFDDLVGSNLFSAKKENPFKRLNTTMRHYSTSAIMVSQAYKEIPKTVRTNASCLVLFEIQNDAELEVIYDENPCGYSRDQWMEFYRICTSEPFGFMVLNYQKPKGQRVWKGFERALG